MPPKQKENPQNQHPLAGGHRLLQPSHAATAPRHGPRAICGDDDPFQRNGGLLHIPVVTAAAR
eukprot:scaffold25962_cov140-Isochrysis_galbana.AAC.1